MAQTTSSAVYVENNAFARAIWGIWATNQRMASIWNFSKCPVELIPRWETILAVPTDTALSIPQRRDNLTHIMSRFSRYPDFGLLIEEIARQIGSMIVAIETINPAIAIMHVPPGGTWPWGTNVPDTNWSSTTFRFLFLVQKTANQTDSQFYDKMGQFTKALSTVIPAWLTYQWYRAPVNYPPISVLGGPSQAGIYLDDEHNLDNPVFDV